MNARTASANQTPYSMFDTRPPLILTLRQPLGSAQSMSELRPAGFWDKVSTFFVPKQLKAHVRTEFLPNGQVEVTPFFEIDGREVPANLVGQAQSQTVLGYGISLDGPSLQVLKKTQGKRATYSKNKAPALLEELEKLNVPVRTKDGKSRPRIARVKPELKLTLGPDDSLVVESELVSPEGVVLPKPTSLEQLKADDGWYAVGDDLLKVTTTNSPLDQVLVSSNSSQTLAGNAVPGFLKLLQKNPQAVGDVERNEPLQGLSIFGESTENSVNVDGDAEALSISPRLVFFGPRGQRFALTADQLKEFENEAGFRREAAGWIEVTPRAANGHVRACQELIEKVGILGDIRGKDIPETLITLNDAQQGGTGWTSPWTVYFSQAVTDSHRIVDTKAQVEFKLNIVDSDGCSLLKLDPIYNHERFQISHSESETVETSGEGWVRRRNAWIKVDEEKYRQIASHIADLGLQRTQAGFTFPASQREQIIEIFSTLGTLQHSAAYSDFLIKLADFKKIAEVPLPSSVKASVTFREYQRHGFNWLSFLHQYGLNGILADDMGLGKTLQCLAVIHRAREKSNANLPSLIICPTSVVSNWKNEALKFFTNTYVLLYSGANRQGIIQRIRSQMRQDARHSECLLVVTSYDIARQDHHILGNIPWLYVVVDEGHNIKNPDAKRSKAIKTLNGRNKLVLTGTPIQNNLEELWSLFDFAMPGFLGSRSHFRETYGRNGQVNWDKVRNGKSPLKERINPFVLRRMKEQVAKDLPPKILVQRMIELKPRQVALYKRVIESAACKKLFQDVSQKGVKSAELEILVAYTKLRAICNHPALGDDERKVVANRSDSGKLEDLWELAEEIIEGEHRALLFCQSTQMLDIIEHHLTTDLRTHKKTLIRLDGDTAQAKRGQLVDQFNSDLSIAFFLISTKAGGTGLNLTGADTVIFYDHDWNPANDNQAQDRAHRIGQTKPVTIYKLISKGTIEEKIIQRQAIKQTLADSIVGTDEQGFKDLSSEELLALFKLDLS
jgi:SNF2 family DNA or RNA helicase